MAETQENATYVNDPMHRIFRYNLSIVTSIELCVHAYFVFLIMTVAKDTLKTFRYCFLFCAVCEACFVAWVGHLWHPRSFMPRWPCTSTEGLLAAFGFNGAVIGVCPFLIPSAIWFQHLGTFFIAGTAVGSQIYAVLYRLVMVTVNGGAEKFVTLPITLLCVVAILAFACALAFVQYTTLGSQAYVSTLLPALRTTGYISENDVAVACNDLSRPADITTTAVTFSALAIFSEALCIAIAIATFYRLRRTTLFSERTKRMYAELTRLLPIQSIVPFIIALIRTLVTHLAILSGIPMNILLVCICMSLVFTFPFFNALLTIYFVRPYRDYTLNLCGRLLPNKTAVVTPT